MAGSMKEWALYYASLGLAVFPLRERDKTPATKNGFIDATTSTKQIEAWWSRWPNCNIGIATGQASGGLVVVDLDIDEDKGINGYETLKEWQREHGELPETWQSITGRGGYHLFFRNSDVCKSRTGLYEGVDIRADGGYIVAPPSIHPNGRAYEWEQRPDEQALAIVTPVVSAFLDGPPRGAGEGGSFELPEAIPEGERTSTLVRLIGSLKAKRLADDSIRAAVRAENEARCSPPLSDRELERTVFPALKRGWKASAPYDVPHKAVCDRGRARPLKECSFELVSLDHIEEKEPEWLVSGYIPRNQITILAGDGGSGKTTVWCSLAAAVSSGKSPFLLKDLVPEDFSRCKPEKVLFFSAEDSCEYVLKRRLRKNGADMKNIFSLDITNEHFREIKFDSAYLENIIERQRPALCIFDPIQAFVPPDIKMGDRNAMRNNLEQLVALCTRYQTTILIVVHANKQSNVWGKKRIADSADIWDISRSVLMAGETETKGVRYLSQEKSNYGITQDTILYTIENEIIVPSARTQKKDQDFVVHAGYNARQAPQKDEAIDFIRDFLKDGEKELAELEALAEVNGFSKSTMKRAKTELRESGELRTRSTGYGKDKKFLVSLCPVEK